MTVGQADDERGQGGGVNTGGVPDRHGTIRDAYAKRLEGDGRFQPVDHSVTESVAGATKWVMRSDPEEWMLRAQQNSDEHVPKNERRQRFISRFAIQELQRKPRRWISFGEIAKWCSASRMNDPSDRQKWDSHFRGELLTALLNRRFEENRRSMVLYLAPSSPGDTAYEPVRLTHDWARQLNDFYSPDDLLTLVLDHCWLHRRVCESWFEGWLAGLGIHMPCDWIADRKSEGQQAAKTTGVAVRAAGVASPAGLEEWHEKWKARNPLGTDDEATSAAKREFGEENITGRMIVDLRRPSDGSLRKRGPKSGKKYAGPR